jgi:site-specific recombinase XerD
LVTDLYLFTLRNAAKGFLISLHVSSRYKPRYLETQERSLAYLCEYAEEKGRPTVAEVTTAHLEEYLAYLQDRLRWYGLYLCTFSLLSSGSLELTATTALPQL